MAHISHSKTSWLSRKRSDTTKQKDFWEEVRDALATIPADLGIEHFGTSSLLLAFNKKDMDIATRILYFNHLTRSENGSNSTIGVHDPQMHLTKLRGIVSGSRCHEKYGI